MTYIIETAKHFFNKMPRYIVVGAILFSIDFALVVALVNYAHSSAAISQLVGRSTGAILGFFAHRHYTFRDNLQTARWNILRQGTAYTAITAIMITITPILLTLFYHVTNENIYIAKALTEACAILATYALLNLVFQKGRTP